jgi:glucose/arabinose dehydrogenase
MTIPFFSRLFQNNDTQNQSSIMTKKLLLLLILLSTACSSLGQQPAATRSPAETTDLILPEGFVGERLPYQFQSPTQFTVQGNYLYVAQLNGGESDKQGQVLRIDLDDGKQQILIDKLDKPTGLAVLGNMLWIATRDAILRTNLTAESALETILENLPNNGRSNGTLTVTPQNTLLYETSGNKRDDDSGKLWELDPETLTVQELASGLKGAYAHAVDADGRIWLTEIADGQVDGATLPDELNLLLPGADFGWPRCYGRELAGPDCANVRPAVATFPLHSTPTSVVVSPFDADTLLVALWLSGEVVQLPITYTGVNAESEPEQFLSGVSRPQHLLVRPDGSLWVSDYATGYIYRIWQE